MCRQCFVSCDGTSYRSSSSDYLSNNQISDKILEPLSSLPTHSSSPLDSASLTTVPLLLDENNYTHLDPKLLPTDHVLHPTTKTDSVNNMKTSPLSNFPTKCVLVVLTYSTFLCPPAHRQYSQNHWQ